MRRPTTPLLTMQLQTVGEVVRVLRSRLDLEQVELARACGWRDASAVSRIETDRIHPTRRTLLKLAENLSNPDITGTPSEVRAWLFLAAGILPTAREVDDLGDRMPDIEKLPHPASVLDFGWYLWRANEWMRKGVGLPERHIGRNYIEMYFEEGGSVRKHLGELWSELALVLVGQFRDDTALRANQRWFIKLQAHLRTLPDFEKMWSSAAEESVSAIGWSRTSVGSGVIGAVRSPLTADPRLIVGQILPEDSDGRDTMLKYGALLE
ncbi:MAG TPA: helix-turn-helix transcriptional regulator [Actinomycetota bacterium]|nr:helix-turn-helix transcriptional regulator [Actinomycetota bacterium]